MQVSDDGNSTIVVIGAGAVGAAIARRQGPGKTLVLADRDEVALYALAGALEGDGYEVIARVTDISVRRSVCDLADCAASSGRISELVMAIGVNEMNARAAEILAVNLQGIGTVLEVFGTEVSRGGSGVVVSSASGYLAESLTLGQEQELAGVWADELLRLPFTDPAHVCDPASAYIISQRCVRVLVQAAAVRWGWRGARVNSISRGVDGCMLGRRRKVEFAEAALRSDRPGRSATPDEIASAAAFLLGPEATFITGIDLLVDGGVVAALRTDQLALLDCADPD